MVSPSSSTAGPFGPRCAAAMVGSSPARAALVTPPGRPAPGRTGGDTLSRTESRSQPGGASCTRGGAPRWTAVGDTAAVIYRATTQPRPSAPAPTQSQLRPGGLPPAGPCPAGFSTGRGRRRLARTRPGRNGAANPVVFHRQSNDPLYRPFGCQGRASQDCQSPHGVPKQTHVGSVQGARHHSALRCLLRGALQSLRMTLHSFATFSSTSCWNTRGNASRSARPVLTTILTTIGVHSGPFTAVCRRFVCRLTLRERTSANVFEQPADGWG
jgi:hypothetical protein